MFIKDKISKYIKEHWEEMGINPQIIHDKETLSIDASEVMKKEGETITVSNKKFGWLMLKPGKEVVKDDKVPGYQYRMNIEAEADPNTTGKERFALIWFGEESGFKGEVMVVTQSA